jgi:hypothetical protein
MSEVTSSDELSAQVRGVLNRVLYQSDFPGRDELAEQVSSVSVVGGPVTMLDLRVNRSTPPSVFADGPILVSVEVSDESGAPIGELLVWVNDGRLSALEFAWWTDEPPRQLPSPGRLKITRK